MCTDVGDFLCVCSRVTILQFLFRSSLQFVVFVQYLRELLCFCHGLRMRLNIYLIAELIIESLEQFCFTESLIYFSSRKPKICFYLLVLIHN